MHHSGDGLGRDGSLQLGLNFRIGTLVLHFDDHLRLRCIEALDQLFLGIAGSAGNRAPVDDIHRAGRRGFSRCAPQSGQQKG